MVASKEGDRQDPVLQHCYQPKGGGFCWKLRWSMAVIALRITLGFGDSRVEKWHRSGKRFRAGLPFTVNLMEGRNFWSETTIYYVFTEHPSKIVFQLDDKMELFKSKAPFLSWTALWSRARKVGLLFQSWATKEFPNLSISSWICCSIGCPHFTERLRETNFFKLWSSPLLQFVHL